MNTNIVNFEYEYKIKIMKDLIERLNQAGEAYYKYDSPIMSDKEYDDLFDELAKLEYETGVILAGSPTQEVQGYVLEGFEKVKHSKPMLSADKTKDPEKIKEFLQGKDFYASFKLDGNTLVTIFENGRFVKGVTRGNGIIGEDVTEQCKFIKNLPLVIPYKDHLELRGECVVPWDTFNEINEQLDEKYKHPRNFAAGGIRNLDLNVVKSRGLEYVVFECISDMGSDSKWHDLDFLSSNMGFETVYRMKGSVDECIEKMIPEEYEYPCDGLVFEIDSKSLSKSLGRTAHHEECRMAYKWQDELYETTLREIQWNTSRTGLINPIAIFDPVDLDGAVTQKATLHNVSYIKKLELGVGDTIQIYRSNMVIPKVHDNLTRSNTWKLPDKCPVCGGDVEIQNENGSETLHCMNPDCGAKLLSRLVHYVSRDCMNIDGLSESTLKTFIDHGLIQNYEDIYKLKDYVDKIKTFDRFGDKKVNNLIIAIEKSRKCTLNSFLTSLGIQLIGKTASNDISTFCHGDIDMFMKLISNKFDWTKIPGIGDTMKDSLNSYFQIHMEEVKRLLSYLEIENVEEESLDTLKGLTFVVTGKVEKFSNRKELIECIKQNGGKVTSSISKNTSYLINNDINSSSSKNKKAKSLNIPIINEDDFIKMIEGD